MIEQFSPICVVPLRDIFVQPLLERSGLLNKNESSEELHWSKYEALFQGNANARALHRHVVEEIYLQTNLETWSEHSRDILSGLNLVGNIEIDSIQGLAASVYEASQVIYKPVG